MPVDNPLMSGAGDALNDRAATTWLVDNHRRHITFMAFWSNQVFWISRVVLLVPAPALEPTTSSILRSGLHMSCARARRNPERIGV